LVPRGGTVRPSGGSAVSASGQGGPRAPVIAVGLIATLHQMDFTHSQRFQAPRPRRLPLLIDPMPDSSGHISDSDAGAQRASPDTLQRSAASSGLRRAKGRQSPCPGGSSTNEAGCTGGRGNFREFMISQRAAQIYKDALHQVRCPLGREFRPARVPAATAQTCLHG
jgi:hypothetical protein